MNLKLLETMVKTKTRTPLKLGGERRVKTVVQEEGGVEGAEEWKRLVQVGAIGVVREETGEAEAEVEGVLEELGGFLVVIGVVLEELGEDHLLDPHQEQEVVGELLIGFALTPPANPTVMGRRRVSAQNVGLPGLAKKGLMGWNLFSINP